MKIKWLTLIVAALLVSCSDNDDIEKERFSNSALFGEWLFYDGMDNNNDGMPDLNSAIVLELNKDYSFEYYVYNKPYEMNESDWMASGNWDFQQSTSLLNTLGNTAIEDSIYSFYHTYYVNKVYECELYVMNILLKAIDRYRRILTTYTKFMDETFKADEFSYYSPLSYISLNPNVAKVDANGNITTVGIGTTFVIAKCDGFETAVKVVVRNGVKEHSAEVNQSIDDIIKKYGDDYVGPYVSDFFESGNFLQLIYYEYPELEPYVKQLQYHYDPTSRAITCIDVYYPLESVSALINDTQYILDSNMYNEYGINGTKRYVYKEYGDFWDSEVYIQLFPIGIRYGSTNFLKCFEYVNVFNDY